VLGEHNGKKINDVVLNTIGAAKIFNGVVDLMIVGHKTEELSKHSSCLDGVDNILTFDALHLEHPLAEDVANIVFNKGKDYQIILAPHTWFSRNILPRAAALLDVSMISDVLKINDDGTYVRATYAGNIHVTLKSDDPIKILTIHSSKFNPVSSNGNANIVKLEVPESLHLSRWEKEKKIQSERPPLINAKVVISGGRSLGSAEKFNDILTPLANKLEAAIGATRAAVDAGYAPNEIQVGQTGVVVAPDLYIAVGVSGANQHIYGMKDSRVVVAINNDPDATIFQFADYGLVADLFEVVPEMATLISK
jgi:electron transfer flavoprotein alpha subunit